MRKERKTVLDEREMLDLYKIEHRGLWLMYAVLLAAVLVQLLLGAKLAQLAGEIAAVMVTSAALIAMNVRSGIWDADARPSMRGNAIYSVLAGASVAAVLAALSRNLLSALLLGAGAAALCMLALTGLMRYVLSRQDKQAKAFDDEDE